MPNIKEIFKHCIQVTVFDDGRIIPSRFTNERLGFYWQQPRTPYGLCPAGITIEFYTDAKEISFDLQMEYTHETNYVFYTGIDVTENGEFTETLLPPMFSYRNTYYLKNKGMTKICMYLPVGYNLTFKNFDLGNWKPVEKNQSKMLLMAGDSIFQGLFGQNPYLAPVPRLARKYGLDYLNLSVGGEIHRGDYFEENLKIKPDIVITELGTNDMGFVGDYDKICRNIEDFYGNLCARFPDAKKIAITPFYMTNYGTGDPDRDKIEAMALRIRDKSFEVCSRLNIPAVDGRTLLPKDPALYADVCHPNNEGFKVLIENLSAEMEKFGII